MKTRILFSVLLLTTIFSCYYDNEEELYNCSTDPTTIKYSTTISSILTSYGCTGCHGTVAPSGGYSLNTYAGVKARVDDKKLAGAINHSPGFVPMPQGGAKMSACDLKKVQAWIDAGAPNN